jgi:hypothetical protein
MDNDYRITCTSIMRLRFGHPLSCCRACLSYRDYEKNKEANRAEQNAYYEAHKNDPTPAWERYGDCDAGDQWRDQGRRVDAHNDPMHQYTSDYERRQDIRYIKELE